MGQYGRPNLALAGILVNTVALEQLLLLIVLQINTLLDNEYLH